MIEVGIVLLAVVLIFGAFLLLRSLKNFVINAIAGLFILSWPISSSARISAIAGWSY